MTPSTLRKERRDKFEAMIRKSIFYQAANIVFPASAYGKDYIDLVVREFATQLAEASISRSEMQAEYKTDGYIRPEGEPNVEVFRGDYLDYPEHLREVAINLRDVWKFTLPHKPKKKKKGQYSMFIMAMEQIRQNCGEFGTKVLDALHADFVAYQIKNNGLAPYTIGQPTSLINVCLGKAREMRDKPVELPEIKKDATGKPETY